MPVLRSAVPEGEHVPALVKRWEDLAAANPGADTATTQLVYELLVQVRVVKLILMWVLIIVPVILIVAGGLLVANGAEPVSRNPFQP